VTRTWTCPSAGTDATSLFNDHDETGGGTALGHMNKGNYVACFGGRNMIHAVPPESLNPKNPDPKMAGLFGMVRINKFPPTARVGRGTPIRKCGDGMSKTVMISEVITWDGQTDTTDDKSAVGAGGNDDWRGAWMVPSVGASAFTGRFPPNATGVINGQSRADRIPACGTGIDKTAAFALMPCEEENSDGNLWASARSKHSGGVNAAMGDGSVRFVADGVEQLVWQAACTRAGGESVSSDF
jgi:prepilin-type processing-associated H-X9-DG protein